MRQKTYWKELMKEQMTSKNSFNKSTLYHKLRSREGMNILKKIHPLTDPEQICKTFFDELNSIYSLNTIWERTLQEKDKRPSYWDNTAKRFQKGRDKKHESTSRGTGTASAQGITGLLCMGSHKTFLCTKLAQADKAMLKEHNKCMVLLREEHKPDQKLWILQWKNFKAGKVKIIYLKCPDCGTNI